MPAGIPVRHCTGPVERPLRREDRARSRDRPLLNHLHALDAGVFVLKIKKRKYFLTRKEDPADAGNCFTRGRKPRAGTPGQWDRIFRTASLPVYDNA